MNNRFAHRCRKPVLVIGLLTMALFSCSLPQVSIELATPAGTAASGPALPVQKTVAATQAVPSPIKTADGEGIHFGYDPSLAQGVTFQNMPGYFASGVDWGYPDYVDAHLDGYPVQGNPQQPRVDIYPVDAYLKVAPSIQAEMDVLRRMLKDQPNALPEKTEIPAPGMSGAAQVLRAQVKYLTFHNGRGVRFITQYVQSQAPVTNGRIFYTFQGLSDDGKYYIAAYLPVTTSALANSDQDAPSFEQLVAQYDTYLNDMTQKLNQLPASAFTPSLDLLDAVVQSLEMKK